MSACTSACGRRAESIGQQRHKLVATSAAWGDLKVREIVRFAKEICDTIEISAKLRGTGIAKRTPEYILKKMQDRDAIIALVDNKFAGFCYIESWEHAKFVAHSGLIVHPKYRNSGLAKKLNLKYLIIHFKNIQMPKCLALLLV